VRTQADQAARQSQLLLGHLVWLLVAGLAPVTGPQWLVRGEVPQARGDLAVRQTRVRLGHWMWVRAMWVRAKWVKAMRLLTLVARQFE